MAAGAFTCEFGVAALLAKVHFDVPAASERLSSLIFPGSRPPPLRVKYLARPPHSISHPPHHTSSTPLQPQPHISIKNINNTINDGPYQADCP
jgi:hypothetical protein